MSDDIYQEQLLAEYAHPKHRGTLAKWTHQATYGNASCGDIFSVQLAVDKKGHVKDVGWEGTGCAVSVAGMSMLSSEIIGKPIEFVERLTYQEVAHWLGMDAISPGRVKCISVGLSATQKALSAVADTSESIEKSRAVETPEPSGASIVANNTGLSEASAVVNPPGSMK